MCAYFCKYAYVTLLMPPPLYIFSLQHPCSLSRYAISPIAIFCIRLQYLYASYQLLFYTESCTLLLRISFDTFNFAFLLNWNRVSSHLANNIILCLSFRICAWVLIKTSYIIFMYYFDYYGKIVVVWTFCILFLASITVSTDNDVCQTSISMHCILQFAFIFGGVILSDRFIDMSSWCATMNVNILDACGQILSSNEATSRASSVYGLVMSSAFDFTLISCIIGFRKDLYE